MCGWPAALDTTRALSLGFAADASVDGIVREYVEELGTKGF
jgi:hypothetical protein